MERKDFLDAIRKLEAQLETALDERDRAQEVIDMQGEESQNLARASMAVREEDITHISNINETNTKLIEFVEKVASSKSKFGKEARNLIY